ncbi:MAG: hypothetical protein H7Y88_02170, partial [Phycisphaerales bacterium]|nr:hypothetical protein [Phycisphaerales bacterium]
MEHDQPSSTPVPELRLALSPYHLTTGELPAVVAAVLGDRVITLMPEPFEGTSKAEVAAAVARSPRYLRLMEAWRWSMPLWRSGLIASSLNGEGVAEAVFGELARIASSPGLDALRAYMRPGVFAQQDSYLEAVATDLLKGGPDPAIGVPVSAGLDAFAAEHGLAVMRSGGGAGSDVMGREPAPSMAQRAEASLGRGLFACAIPVPVRAAGGLLLTL